MEYKDMDLSMLPPKSDEGEIKYKQDLDPRLPNVNKGLMILLLGIPGAGKSVLILNILGRFLKYYYENIHFITPSPDKTLQPLFDYYGPPHKDCNNNIIEGIISSQLDQDDDDITDYPRSNACVVIDDALAMKNFNSRKMNSIARFVSNYRHILRGHLPHQEEGKKHKTHGGGGMLLISTQRYSSTIPTSMKSCANTILVGKMANKSDYKNLIDDYGERCGGEEQLRNMINECLEEQYGFCCIYLDGDLDPETHGCVVYKNMSEKLYPTERYPEKPMQI